MKGSVDVNIFDEEGIDSGIDYGDGWGFTG